MRRRYNKGDMEKLLVAAFESTSDEVVGLSGDNPQVVEMRNKAIGKNEAYLSALQALRGDAVTLKIDGGVYAV